jgi:5-methylcytosine-specific restriction protein A
MRSPAEQTFLDRIVAGLRRKSVTQASRWATTYRVMGPPYPGQWTFKYHPWLKEMHDSKAEHNVGRKSAQMGFTETVLNLVFYNIDVLSVNCLYVLPALKPDATDFSASRFDPALELSDYLTKLFSDVKNIGHKRAGTTNLYIRGSKSRAGLKSVPVGLIILDEVDEMRQKNIPLALERSAGQLHKQDWMISTPTIPEYGIEKYFSETTKEHFFFSCPHCSKQIELIFPESMIITADNVGDPREHDRRRADDQAWRGWYSLALWRNPRDGLRMQQLRRQPLCETCIANGVRPPNPATVAHHKTPHEGDWQLFVDPDNHASACKPCHDGDLQREEHAARRQRGRGVKSQRF